MRRTILLTILLAVAMVLPSLALAKDKGAIVLDAQDRELGILLGTWSVSWIQIFVPELGLMTSISRHQDATFVTHTPSNVVLWFDDYDCNGDPWMPVTNSLKSLCGQLFRMKKPDGSGGFEWHYFTPVESADSPGNVETYSSISADGTQCLSPYIGSFTGYKLREVTAEMPPVLLDYQVPLSYEMR